MKQIKTYIFNNFETLIVLSFATICSMVLLAIRLKITSSHFLLFLIWNLFLAAIPYILSSYLQARKTTNAFVFTSCSIVWLLFLPNAPYIVTDLIHLNHPSSISLILDGILILSFAFSGLLFYLYSFRQMLSQFEKRVSRKLFIALKYGIPFLTGYGIYLGRFERWNSWNIINDPLLLFQNMIATLTDPSTIGLVLTTTISTGIGLILSTRLFNKYFSP